MKSSWMINALLMSTLINTPLLACPCFNAYHVESIFKDSINIDCETYLTHNYIDTIVLSDGKTTAMGTHEGCKLLADYHSVIFSFPPSSIPHEECIIALDRACDQLKAKRVPYFNNSTPAYQGHYN